MSRNNRSIGERLKRAKSAERRAEVASEWVENWIGMANPNFKEIEEDIINGDYNPAQEGLHNLYSETFKRLYALKNIFAKIAEAPKRAEVDAEHEQREQEHNPEKNNEIVEKSVDIQKNSGKIRPVKVVAHKSVGLK